jgi:hypothetical protein
MEYALVRAHEGRSHRDGRPSPRSSELEQLRRFEIRHESNSVGGAHIDQDITFASIGDREAVRRNLGTTDAWSELQATDRPEPSLDDNAVAGLSGMGHDERHAAQRIAAKVFPRPIGIPEVDSNLSVGAM